MWSHINHSKAKILFHTGKTRAIFEIKRISSCSPAWSFLTFRCTAEKAPGPLGTHRAEHRLPRNQLTVFILLIHYWKLFLQLHFKNKGIAVVTFNFTDRTRRIFWESFFFFCLLGFFPFFSLKFPKTWLPSSNFCRSICQFYEGVEKAFCYHAVQKGRHRFGIYPLCIGQFAPKKMWLW